MYNRCSINKNYNLDAQYEIIGRIPKGTSVLGYILLDRFSGEKVIFDKEVVEQLALDKHIYNAKAQIYKDLVNVKGINCKLSQLPRYNKEGELIEEVRAKAKKPKAVFTLVGRVMNGSAVISYQVEYLDNTHNIATKIIDKEQVLGLAREGYIKNAKAQMNNGKLILRGINTELSLLKTITSEV